jgi:hypothetical protein
MKGFITLLVLVVIALCGVAFYRNWIVVEKAPAPSGDATQINITVDRAKARHDIQEARQEASELVQKAREGAENLVQTSTLKGEIQAIDPEARQVTLMVDGQPQVVHVQADADVQRDNAKVSLEALKVGDIATVKIKDEKGVKAAQSVSVGANN